MEKRIIDWIVMELGERKVWLAKGPSCLWQREPKGNHCHPFLPVTGVLHVQENSTSLLALNHSRFFTNFSTSFLFFYFSILLLSPRFGGKIKMGYLHMLAHLSSCVISWKQRKNRQFWKNYYIMEEFLGRISLILYVDNIETSKNKRNNVYYLSTINPPKLI